MGNFENVKIGDEIIYNTGGWYNQSVITNVAKVTQKQFVDERGATFKKADGTMIGDRYRHCRYATDEDKKAYEDARKRRELLNRIKDFFQGFKYGGIKTEELESINAIISKYIPPNG